MQYEKRALMARIFSIHTHTMSCTCDCKNELSASTRGGEVLTVAIKNTRKEKEGRWWVQVQWNLSITDTLGTTSSVPIKEVSLLQRLFCTLLYVAGTMNSVPIKEVSLFRRSLIERFHCTQSSCFSLLHTANIQPCISCTPAQ